MSRFSLVVGGGVRHVYAAFLASSTLCASSGRCSAALSSHKSLTPWTLRKDFSAPESRQRPSAWSSRRHDRPSRGAWSRARCRSTHHPLEQPDQALSRTPGSGWLSRRLTTRAGTPPIIVIGGTSEVTTAPAAMTLPLPIVTPSSTLAPDPIQTSSSTTIPRLERPWRAIGRSGSAKTWLAGIRTQCAAILTNGPVCRPPWP